MKYYYYVALITKSGTVFYTNGNVKTTFNDFPLLETKNKLAENHSITPGDIVITFYNEITEENYKTLQQ